MKPEDIIKRAQDAINAGIFFDASIRLAGKIDQDTGFLTVPVTLARVGVQQYLGFELGLMDRAFEKIGVFRSPEEVFSDDSIKSFTNLVVTDDHPDSVVTVDNVKALQRGQVSGVAQDGKVLGGVATITDKDQIVKAVDGKVEVSVGYSNDLVAKVGEFEGVGYEFIQTNIRANHLAIVDAGRCGPACKLTVDQKEVPMIKITIDGIEFEVSTQAAQAFTKYSTDMAQKVKDAEAETAAEVKKREDAEAEKEKATAKADAAEKEKVSDEEMEKKVNDRATLISSSRLILGDKHDELTKDCGTCDTKLKAAVIGHVMKDIDLSGKADAYIDAMFDVAVGKHQKAKDSNTKLGDDLGVGTIMKDKDGNEVTRDSLRKAHNATLGMEVE